MKALWNRIVAWFTYRDKIDTSDTYKDSDYVKVVRVNCNDQIGTARMHDIAEDGPEEIIGINRNKMHNFIEEKKNRKPFYKDDNKKTWE